MKYRNFGSTGLQISEIVFGAGAQGGLVFRGEKETRLEAVRRALNCGINWVDTAAQYGDGQSEENLGWILKELGANPYFSTKVRISPEHVGDISEQWSDRSKPVCSGFSGKASTCFFCIPPSP